MNKKRSGKELFGCFGTGGGAKGKKPLYSGDFFVNNRSEASFGRKENEDGP